MPKLYLKRGLPGSGKSTSAREMVAKDGNTARINFDDLRSMLFNGKWSPTREKVVNEICAKLVAKLSESAMNVVIDNTNLTEGHVMRYKNLAQMFGMEFVEQRHDAGIELCVSNDLLRQGSGGHVGRAVIERLAIQSGWFKFKPEEKLVLVDVDGTLADSSHRAKEFLRIPSGEGFKNEWDKFFAAAGNDEPIYAVQKWVQEIAASGWYTIVICSGRSDDYATPTCEWLNKHNIPYDHVLMRKRGDKREDWIVKQEILNMLPKQQIAFILDDRQQVIDMWRRVKQQENLTYHVFQVAEGNF